MLNIFSSCCSRSSKYYDEDSSVNLFVPLDIDSARYSNRCKTAYEEKLVNWFLKLQRQFLNKKKVLLFTENIGQIAFGHALTL